MDNTTETSHDEQPAPRTRRAATADTTAPQKPRRQLRIDPQAATVLDNFATLNGLGFAPSVQEVLDAASDVACKHIATLYEAATSKMRKLDQ